MHMVYSVIFSIYFLMSSNNVMTIHYQWLSDHMTTYTMSLAIIQCSTRCYYVYTYNGA